MIRYPKARKAGFTLVLFFALAFSGCSCQERYAPFLRQVEKNIRTGAADLDKALKANGRPDDLRKNDVGVLTDTADACARVRTGSIDAWKGEK